MLIALAVSPSVGRAQSFNGSAGDAWEIDLNWSPIHVPGPDDAASISGYDVTRTYVGGVGSVSVGGHGSLAILNHFDVGQSTLINGNSTLSLGAWVRFNSGQLYVQNGNFVAGDFSRASIDSLTLIDSNVVLGDGAVFQRNQSIDGGFSMSNSTITGAGRIGGEVSIDSDSKIIAAGTASFPLIVSSFMDSGSPENGVAVTNNGLITTQVFGYLSLSGNIDNRHGVISVASREQDLGDYTGTVKNFANILGGKLVGSATTNDSEGAFYLGGKLDGGTSPVELQGYFKIANATLTGSIINHGSILPSNGNNLYVSNSLALSGGGSIVLPGTLTNSPTSAFTVVTQSQHSIEGSGTIGGTSFTLSNDAGGDVNANVPGQTLSLYESTSTLSPIPIHNAGFLRATNGGTLSIFGSGDANRLNFVGIDNTGGMILADVGSKVELRNIDVRGGTLLTIRDNNNHANDGVIRVNGSILDGTGSTPIQNLGHLDGIGEGIRLRGEITGGTLTGKVNVIGDVTLGAQLSGDPGEFFFLDTQGPAPRTVTNTSSIHGSGFMGAASVDTLNLINAPGAIIEGDFVSLFMHNLVNQGLIHAAPNGTVSIQPSNNNGAFVNHNVVRAESLSQIQLINFSGATTTNNGSVEATAGGKVSIVNFGTGTFTNNGALKATDGGTVDANSLTNLNSGRLVGGQYLVSGASSIAKLPDFVTSLKASITIDGQGAQIQTHDYQTSALGFLANIEAGGSLTLKNSHREETDGSLANAGDLVIRDHSTLNVHGHFSQTSGELYMPDIDSSLIAQGGFHISGGTVKGQGHIVSPQLTIEASLISPGNSPGLLSLDGNTSLAGTTALLMEVAGPGIGIGYDSITVTGMMNLADAVLQVSLIDDWYLRVTQQDVFTLVSAPSLVGQFHGLADGARFDTIDGHGSFAIHYTTNAVQLSDFQVHSVPEPSAYMLAAVGFIGAVLLRKRASICR